MVPSDGPGPVVPIQANDQGQIILDVQKFPFNVNNKFWEYQINNFDTPNIKYGDGNQTEDNFSDIKRSFS